MIVRQIALAVALSVFAAASAAGVEEPRHFTSETICRLIDAAADDHGLPSPFFTRLIWQESAFRISAVSPKGAQGVAQFMPGTAIDRGLADPFDPEQAIPASANFLGELADEFGNLGLAAAAYNAGPRRVSDWLAGRGGLPGETRHYVQVITGVNAEGWKAAEAAVAPLIEAESNCLETVALLGRPSRPQFAATRSASFWGGRADRFAPYSATARAQEVRTRVLRPTTGASQAGGPLIIRVPSRGGSLCGAMQKAGGACASVRR